ncbi:uncharacterized protein [Aquarana catesbeiana]|uniref:uncharacterized protein n=1 Tax=Aquarana catesbeiana TaxID=8400 RepID=UPI003CC97CC3
MMNPVIYADLKFTDIAPMDTKHRGSTMEDLNEDGDIMYENVTGLQPSREHRPPPTPPMGRGHQLMAGLRGCSLHLSLVFLLLCLILSAAVIGLTVKYVQLSGNLQKSVTDHRAISSSMTRSLRTAEDLLESIKRQLGATKTELEKTRQELRKVSQDNQALENRLKSKEDLLDSGHKDLMATKTQLEKTRSELEKAERGNTDMESALSQCRKEEQKSADDRQLAEETRSKLDKCNQDIRDFCPEGWVLYRKKCLWFSKEEGYWSKGESDCERRDSNLIIVPYYDTDLKKFIGEKQGSYWVGKEWNKQKKNWEWPEDYESSSSYYSWRISYGNLNNKGYYKNRWICEKNIILTSAQTSCRT